MEEWKPVVGYDGMYEVSNIGRIKSLKYGKFRLLKLLTSHTGYKYITLCKEGKSSKSVHRIVAKAFIPNPELKPQVNHKNGKKADNRVENLEWCTILENNLHAIRTGLNKGTKGCTFIGRKGKECSLSKIVIQYSIGGEFIRKWNCAYDVERELGIWQSSISQCCTGKLKTSGGFIWKYK